MATVELQAIARRETMVDAIANALIRYIAENGLEGGDRLPSERELVEMIGASRLPLREALSVLKGLGIIEARHGKGIFVKQLDPAAVFGMLSPLLKIQAGIDVRHLFEARLPLEMEIAALAAEHRTEEHLAMLDGELEAMRAALRQRPEYVTHDRAFHQTLARATANPVFDVFMASLTDLLAELHERYRDRIEFRQEAVREHEEILDAVRRRDAEAARRTIRLHLANSLKRM
ncbi:MAG: FadR family transcriptional regulator [Pirellulales bacterium]|nr:FadR family transcriptional regulator [Pirellulales bacterium]